MTERRVTATPTPWSLGAPRRMGSTLGRVVHWASPAFPPLPASSAVADARRALAQQTVLAFEGESFLAGTDAGLRAEICAHLKSEASGVDGNDPRELDRMRLQLAVLERKRYELIGLVADRHVEDSVMWDLQHLLDREEYRLDARLTAAILADPVIGSIAEEHGTTGPSGDPPLGPARTVHHRQVH